MRRRWLALALYAGLATLYCLTLNHHPSFDVTSADFASWQLAETGDPVPELWKYPALDDSITRDIWVVHTADGREAIGRAPGVIAATVPAYAVAQLDHRSDVPGGITAGLLTAGAVTMMFLALRELVGELRALAGTLVLGLTTPVWTVAGDALWPHTVTVLGIAGIAWAAAKERWWLVGVFGGIALWGRLHFAIAVAVLGIGLALWRRRPAIAAQIGLPSLALLGLMCGWTRWMYGSWNPTAGYTLGGVTGHALHWSILLDQVGFWISPYRGVFVWTPLTLLLLPALVRSWRRLPDWTRVLPVATLLYTFVEVALDNFTGGDHFYAYRHGLEIVTAAAPALLLSVQRLGPVARRWVAPLAVVQLVMMVPGALFHLADATDSDPWTTNTLVSGFGQAPLIVGLTMAAAALAGALVVRRWPRPVGGPVSGPVSESVAGEPREQ